jgi:hypothetical protein
VNKILMKNLLLIFISIGTFAIFADEKKRVIRIDTDLNGQVCWYQNEKFSQGAIIKTDQHHLICELKSINQPNGALAWFKTDDNGLPIYPKPPARITIN